MAIPGNMLAAATESMDPTYTGWRARSNCTLLAGTGGRNGDRSLSVKSSAAGEVQAETVAAYPVVAGQDYQVFADSSSATEPERIGILWLDASLAAVGSILWSLTTATASSTWHRVGVAGTAPVGAVQARVVLSSTAASSAVSHYWENVYLGAPVRTVGNLLGFNAESIEVDTSGWAPETNCTLSRQAPMVSWPVDWYLAGGQVLAVTATAGGNASAASVETPGVTVGVQYQAYCYLAPPTTGSVTWIELRFYNAANTLLTATRAPLAPATTGYHRQRVSATAPAGAVTARMAVGIDSATAGQVLRIEQAVIATAPVVQAGTVIPYADASFEQGIAGWTVVSGAATLTRSTPWGAYGVDGAYALTVSSATATSSTIRSAKFPLPAGAGGLSFRLRFSSQVTAGGWTYTAGIRWYSATNVDLGLTAPAPLAVPASGWWNLGTDQTAPAGATQAAVEWTFTATATSSVLRLDKVALWQALPITAAETVEQTASVTITLRELTSGTLLRLSRIDASGARTLVRGPSGLFDGTYVVPSDLLVIEDYEAPLGVAINYYAEFLTTGGAVQSYRAVGPLTIPHADANWAWLKDPGNPQRNMQVVVAQAPNWQRPVEQSTYVVKGRRNKVILSGRRQGLEGDLVVWTLSDDQRIALHWLLDSSSTLLWQAAPGMGVSDMYVSVGQITEERTGGTAREQMRAWTLPLVETDMPTAIGVNGSGGRTWIDVVAEFATCNDVLATYTTCEDLLLDRR